MQQRHLVNQVMPMGQGHPGGAGWPEPIAWVSEFVRVDHVDGSVGRTDKI